MSILAIQLYVMAQQAAWQAPMNRYACYTVGEMATTTVTLIVRPQGPAQWVRTPGDGPYTLLSQKFEVVSGRDHGLDKPLECLFSISGNHAEQLPPLREGLYLLTCSLPGKETKLLRAEKHYDSKPDFPTRVLPPHFEGVVGVALVPTVQSALAPGKTSIETTFESWVKNLESTDITTFKSTIRLLMGAHPAHGGPIWDVLPPDFPGEHYRVGTRTSHEYQQEVLTPRVLALARKSKGARALYLYGLLGRWETFVAGDEILDAILNWDSPEKDAYLTDSRSSADDLYEVGGCKVSAEKWLKAMHSGTPTFVKSVVMRRFKADIPEKEWPAIFSMYTTFADVADRSTILASLSVWSGQQGLLDRMSPEDQVIYWSKRLKVSP